MSIVPSDSRAVAQQDGPSFGTQLAEKAAAFRQMLPDGIDEKKFSRVVMTAVQRNRDLLTADRQSLWNACVQAAGDGLIPDGREGALVVYGTKRKFKGEDGRERDEYIKAVQFLPMVAGIKKRVRQSGEIATWDAYVAHRKDKFRFALGDNPFIEHEPYMDGDPGPIIAAYSVATLKSGEKSREVMTKAQLDRVKAASQSKGNYGPWKDWEEEMCRKTVIKRHAKSLPMSTEVADLVGRDNAFDSFNDAMPTIAAPVRDPLADALPPPSDPPHDPATGEIDPDEPPAAPLPDDTPADPRDALLSTLRSAVMDGKRVAALLQTLAPEQRDLVTEDDRKALLDAQKAVAAQNGGAS